LKLSEDLKKWRIERPDEWTMDRFIKNAEIMETLCDEWFLSPMVRPYAGANEECLFCGASMGKNGNAHHSAADCPHLKYLDIIKE